CKSPLSSDTTAGTSLVSMYSKCRELKDAWKLFVRIQRKDLVSWNAMISGYAQHGAGEKALELFDAMKHDGMKPDWITFVAVFLACNHAGFVDLGVQYFDFVVFGPLILAVFVCMLYAELLWGLPNLTAVLGKLKEACTLRCGSSKNQNQSRKSKMVLSKFKVEKFDGSNDFSLWKLKVQALLVLQGSETALE
ncbi:hypothetical protein S245_048701, partial [Arachis hypogaea]